MLEQTDRIGHNPDLHLPEAVLKPLFEVPPELIGRGSSFRIHHEANEFVLLFMPTRHPQP
jgi:hypothetical protein